MLDCYSRKVDPYINLAQQMNPGHDKKFYKQVRGSYKVILLGAMYGMGVPLMAQRAEIDEDDCQQKYDEMFKHMSGIKQFMIDKGQYCVDHNGECESILGDKLYMEKGDEDRYMRLGVNQVIQSFAAVSLADGFENIIHHSYVDKDIIVRPVNVVHDSSQNYFEIGKLFDIIPYYQKHLTEYLWNKYHVNYLFDVELGTNYFDLVDASQIDEDTLELKGTYLSIKSTIEKCIESGLKFKILKLVDADDNELSGLSDERFKPQLTKNLYENCYQENGVTPRYNFDQSSYKITITRKFDE